MEATLSHATLQESPNGWIFGGLVLVHAAILIGLPLMHASVLVWVLALLPMVWLNIVHWGLIHEAIHKLLFADARQNERGGRVLAILMGTSFHVLRFGHLMHHKLNRQFQAECVVAATPGAQLYYYAHLLLGLYASEVVSGILFLILPRPLFMKLAHATFLRKYEPVANAGERFFYERGNIAKTRTDVALGLALYAGLFVLAGKQWVGVLAFIILRAGIISFMDNIYHYATPTDNSKPGKELALPLAISALLLHGNYHETHHANPDMPWLQLPQLHAAQGRHFDGDFVAHGLMQFSGPPVAL